MQSLLYKLTKHVHNIDDDKSKIDVIDNIISVCNSLKNDIELKQKTKYYKKKLLSLHDNKSLINLTKQLDVINYDRTLWNCNEKTIICIEFDIFSIEIDYDLRKHNDSLCVTLYHDKKSVTYKNSNITNKPILKKIFDTLNLNTVVLDEFIQYIQHIIDIVIERELLFN